MALLESPTNPLAQAAEAVFLRRLTALCASLKSLYPHIEVDLWSCSFGSLTENHWDIGVECVSPVAPDGEHCATLTVEFRDLNTEPTVQVDLACGNVSLESPQLSAGDWQYILPNYKNYQQVFIESMTKWKWNGNNH
jgi:hypothetical protein